MSGREQCTTIYLLERSKSIVQQVQMTCSSRKRGSSFGQPPPFRRMIDHARIGLAPVTEAPFAPSSPSSPSFLLHSFSLLYIRTLLQAQSNSTNITGQKRSEQSLFIEVHSMNRPDSLRVNLKGAATINFVYQVYRIKSFGISIIVIT